MIPLRFKKELDMSDMKKRLHNYYCVIARSASDVAIYCIISMKPMHNSRPLHNSLG